MAALHRSLIRLIAFLTAAALMAQPAMAQSVLRDAETEALLRDMADPLVEAAGLRPGNVDIVLVNDSSINAFVAGGQVVYIHSGLLNAAESANEVQGVIAHELGHIVGGHALGNPDGTRGARNISILSLLVGIAAAVAGSGDAAMAAVMAGQQAALGKYLAFSRAQESSADAAGAQYLSDAGITGRGSLSFFGKLQNREYRYGYSQSDDAAFTRTHPLSGDRISALRGVYEKDPAWDAPLNPEWESEFARVKAKLKGYIAEPRYTFRDYPQTDQTVPARYARAYAYHKTAQVDRALAETDRRRARQIAYNEEHGITPATVRKNVEDVLAGLYAGDTDMNRVTATVDKVGIGQNLQAHLEGLKEDMRKAAENLEFEEAARLRDEVKRLEAVDLAVADDPMARQAAGEAAGDKAVKGRSTAGKPGQRAGRGKRR